MDGLTGCATCVWAGVDSAWKQENAEARKMLENAAESHTSGARFVRPRAYFATRRETDGSPSLRNDSNSG